MCSTLCSTVQFHPQVSVAAAALNVLLAMVLVRRLVVLTSLRRSVFSQLAISRRRVCILAGWS